MTDSKYCYPDSGTLINKLNLRDPDELCNAEMELALIRLLELQMKPIKGNFGFDHLKSIHRYIFQDIYEWAGKVRTVEIGKGNIFCTTRYISDYARTVFGSYYPKCYEARNDRDSFIRTLADNYGDLNALHPFREGNGRAQREFARCVCLECGYFIDWTGTSHREMLSASRLSFDKGDSSAFIKIFSKIVQPIAQRDSSAADTIEITTAEDL